MSIRFRQAAGIHLGSDPTKGLNASKATFAFRMRINQVPSAGSGQDYLSSNTFRVSANTPDATHNTVQCLFVWKVSGSSPQVSVSIPIGVVNYFVLVYDKDNASDQAVYVNGQKTLMNFSQTIPFTTQTTNVDVGFFADNVTRITDYEIEAPYELSDYAFTQADVDAVMEGTDPTTIGGAASYRSYWTFQGTVGDVPAVGDAGITNQFDGSVDPSIYVGPTTPNSSLTYTEAMPYVPPAVISGPRVYSDGTTIVLPFVTSSTGSPALLVGGSMTTAPTIKINGGSPITLERPLYTSKHTGILFFTPSGTTISQGDVVTLSAPYKWITTALGYAGAVTDLAVTNRSGQAVYGDLPPTMRMGLNYTIGAQYWHFSKSFKNRARSAAATPTSAKYRADGTISSYANLRMEDTAYNNTVDRTLSPLIRGKYLVSFDDNDTANPTTIAVVSAVYTRSSFCYELPEYRNNGDASGVGKAYVYQVDKTQWTVSLAADCTSSDTVLTLASVADCNGRPYSAGKPGAEQQWVKIDDEYMQIASVNTGASQITVVRGEFGSTPAAHTSGTSGHMECYGQSFPVNLLFQGSNGNGPNYKNLVVFRPGDWTVPATPGPVTADRSTASLQGTSQFVKDSLANGAGVVRHMDSTIGGFGVQCEPDQMPLDSDIWWGEDEKFNIAVKITSTEPATAATVPYTYSHLQFQNAEKYNATLGADITTAPAAGTVETVTISDAATAPVMAHQRLEFPSGEVCRVVSVSGTDVTIVRGSERTTPATQAAGSILVRWRTPITADATLEGNDNVRVHHTTDGPHGLWTGCYPSYPSTGDLNPLARINVTLTADVTTTTETTFHVSVAAGDAQYLAPNLIIKFDDELVRVISYDPGTGAMRVRRANVGNAPNRFTGAKTAATHTSGTVGTGSSNGVFCRAKDGSAYSWTFQPLYHLPVTVTGPNTYIAIQAPTPAIGQPYIQVGTQAYSPAVDDGTTNVVTVSGPNGAYSYEHIARVTSLAPGAHHWLNIPQFASNDMVDAIAVATRDNLPPGKHKVLVELGNEIWNFSLPKLGSFTDMSNFAGYGDIRDSWVIRTREVTDRVKAVFNDAGRGDEVKCVFAWQQGSLNLVLDRATAHGVIVDVVSTAPYFRTGNTSAQIDTWNNSTDEQCIEAWKFELEYNTATINTQLVKDAASKKTYEDAMLGGAKMEFIHYEGGLDSCTPVPETLITNGRQRDLDQYYNPGRVFAEARLPVHLEPRRRHGRHRDLQPLPAAVQVHGSKRRHMAVALGPDRMGRPTGGLRRRPQRHSGQPTLPPDAWQDVYEDGSRQPGRDERLCENARVSRLQRCIHRVCLGQSSPRNRRRHRRRWRRRHRRR